MAHLQPQPEVEEAPQPTKKKRGDGSDDDEEEEEEEVPAAAEEEDEEAAKKKKQEKKPREITPLIGRPEPSERDMMIELVFEKAVVMQSSSTILAVSCFNNKQVLICNVDIKTRSKSIRHKIDTKESPTYLF